MEPTINRNRSNKKRPLRPSNDGRSKKRKRGSSLATFPLTVNAIESLVRGVALCPSGGDRPVIDENRRSNNSNTVQAGGNENGGTHTDQLVLRLRIDQVATAEAASAFKKGETKEPDRIAVLCGAACDGKHSIRVLLLDESGNLSRRLDKEKGRGKKYDWIISVKGYTSTEATWNTKYELYPIICFTCVNVLSTTKRKGSLGVNFPCDTLVSIRARAGTIGSFLTDRAPFLSNEELGGSSKIHSEMFLSCGHLSASFRPSPSGLTNGETSGNSSTVRVLFPQTVGGNRKRVQDFMAFANAMKTLKEASSSSPSPSPPASPSPSSSQVNNSPSLFSPTKLPTEHAAELYCKTVEEFWSSQMDRQNSSLGTNAGRESAERATLIVQRHKDALEMAMNEERPLSVEILCSWHRELLKDIHPEAGEIRTRTVRCGQTVFCPTSRIRLELEMYCSGLLNLSERFDMNNALHVVLYAAIAMYGIVDIHPFLDGNGRLSRIVANYALKRLPFPINLFATPGQRAEYVLAIEQTRHILSSSGKGSVTAEQELQVVKFAGAFDSLTSLLMDRVAKAVLECNKVWQEKSGMAAEAAEARAARRARERAAKGTCIICFEDRPNIATLCCGKATHLNCIAEWLSGKNTCPVCRSEMPSISGRVVRAARRSEEIGRTGERDPGVGEALEAAQQQILQNIRETRDLLAREYDRVAQRGRHEDNDSSDSSSFLSDPSDTSILDTTTTTTTSDEEETELSLVHRSLAAAENSSGSEQDRDVGDSTSEGSDVPIDELDDTTTTVIDPRSDETSTEEADEDEMPVTTTTTSLGSSDADNVEARDLENDDERHGQATATTAESDENTNSDGNNAGESRRSRQRLSFCAGALCRNQAAVDCCNQLCGRCCVLAGEFHCPRHNS